MFSKQRSIFGTTFQMPYQGWRHEASPDMNDSIRAAFCIPPLKHLNDLFQQEKHGAPPLNVDRDQFWDVNHKGCQ